MSPRPDNSRVRMRIAGLVVAALFGAMFARLWYLQVLDAPSFQRAVVNNQVRTVYQQGPRGEILDRNGNVLVSNTVTETITLDRVSAVRHPEVVSRLAVLTGKPKGYVEAQLVNPRYSPYKPVPILTRVPMDMVVYLREHQDEFPGVQVQLDTERYYPYNTTAAHVLGYVGDASAADLAAFKGQGYRDGDTIGKDGVERSYESVLRGREGVTKLEVNASGQVVRTLSADPPKPGDNVQLSVDLGLQQEVEKDLLNQIMSLRGQHDSANHGAVITAPYGAAAVIDPQNGQVLAMASYPTYNPSDFVGGISASQLAAYSPPASGPSSALSNQAIGGFFTPGSTFKLITATAALNSGLINADYSFPDPGSFTVPGCNGGAGAQCSFKDDDPAEAGTYNVRSALTASDDVFFYNLGYQFWVQRGRYGDTPIQDTALEYGLSIPTGIPLPNEASDGVDSPQRRQYLYTHAPGKFYTGQWFAGDNIEMAFGQGGTTVTPLQLDNAYATFANGGTRYQPQIAAQITDPNGKPIKAVGPVVSGHVDLPPSTRDPMLQGFEGVTVSGTAAGAFAGFPQDQMQVAGKTGTATDGTDPNGEPISLFVGFAPASNPQYCVAVAIDKAGYGAAASAPVVRSIYDYLLTHPIGPVQNPSQAPQPPQPQPSP